MKKVLEISIGGRNFFLDEDAYERLGVYLGHFRSKLYDGNASMSFQQAEEVMNDLEVRIAELFEREVGYGSRVVNIDLVQRVTSQLGMPDGSAEPGNGFAGYNAGYGSGGQRNGAPSMYRKMYRNIDEKALGGVCSGLAAYFDIDTALVRVLTLLAVFFGTAGFWIYIILWIVIPKADTPAKKCEMFGLPVTAENLARFSQSGGRR